VEAQVDLTHQQREQRRVKTHSWLWSTAAAAFVLLAVAAAMQAPDAVTANARKVLQSTAESALHHLLTPRVRRWIMCEWHYSGIDRPFFMKNELQVGGAGLSWAELGSSHMMAAAVDQTGFSRSRTDAESI